MSSRLTRRQSARLNPGPSPATTNSTANPSPAFSTVSSVGHETPPTSDDELPLVAAGASKHEFDAKPAPKRRASAKQVYVELEAPQRGKGKAQASLVPDTHAPAV